MDNYFVMGAVFDWYGNKGLGIIGTNVRNRPPKDIGPFYPHKENKNTTMKHTKGARLFGPIVAVRKIGEVSSVCMFLSNQCHPVILHLLMLSMNVPTLLSYVKKE